MIKKIELLVHAGAPSGRKDDERYKTQAEVYLAFDGQVISASSSRPIAPVLLSKARKDRSGNVPLPVDRDEVTALKYDPAIYLDDTQLGYTALDSQLLTSSLALPLGSPPSLVGRASCRPSTPQQNLEGVEPSLESGELASSTHKSSLSQDWAVRKRRREDEVVHAACPEEHGQHTQHKTGDAHHPSQSSYLRSPVLDRSAKKQKVNNANHHPTTVPALISYIPLPENGRTGVAYVGEKPVPSTEHAVPATKTASQQSAGGNESTSELPTSYSLSDITSESSRARQGVSQRSVSDPGPLVASISPTATRAVPTPDKVYGISKHAATQPAKDFRRPEISSPAHVDDKATTSKVGKQAKDGQKAVSKGLPIQQAKHQQPSPIPAEQVRLESGVNAPARTINRVTTSKTDKQANDKQKGVLSVLPAQQAKPQQPSPISAEQVTLPTTIRPPAPAAALDKYTTHVTDALRHLVENPDIAHSYKPVSVARELRPVERGYWLIDCSPWDLELQIHFWQSLAKFIGDGRMGWGVWCSREKEESGTSEDDEDQLGPGGAMQQLGIGTVKVFCWGEIVKHIFLLLYIASKSKVRKEGLQWLDAADKVVVQMRTVKEEQKAESKEAALEKRGHFARIPSILERSQAGGLSK
ncbi:hypothetical protein LTR37_019177 [Vermiconidia calcicola]|uniref:Uncharacterized protein n=1 Tax=Vermiconidia calcicola TaxID=1690605 RepID=A0ACC3MGB5_9PEZI|nr:hypothetical protein LTR37_019177 [Vermiconidia calcicola]